MRKKFFIITLFIAIFIICYPIKAQTQEAINYFNKGNSYYNSARFNMAAENYKKAIQGSPKFLEAYYNLALVYTHMGQTDLAIDSYNKVLKIAPLHKDSRKNLAVIYYNQAVNYYNNYAYPLAESCLTKSIKYDSTNLNAYSLLGSTYVNLNNYDKAEYYFKKVAALDPYDEQNNQNLKNISRLKEENSLNEKITYITPQIKAPASLYNLVAVENGVNSNILYDAYRMLDLLWGDNEGQRLLTIIINHKIPIKINNDNRTEATQQKLYLTYMFIPIVPIYKDTAIYISKNEILSFYNQNASSQERIYGLVALVHELCHSVKTLDILYPSKDSVFEEIGANMVGYNVASRILNNRELTPDEVYENAQNSMIGILQDKHRDLPLNKNFEDEMKRLGISLPYPEKYRNITSLYNSVRNSPGFIRCTKFEK